MGERGNIEIRQEPKSPSVWFYTHHKGYRTAEIVKKALARRAQWQDSSYLARIIFCELIDGDTHSETGYGISTFECDPNYPRVLVDVPNQTVQVGNDTPVSFEDFIQQRD